MLGYIPLTATGVFLVGIKVEGEKALRRMGLGSLDLGAWSLWVRWDSQICLRLSQT